MFINLVNGEATFNTVHVDDIAKSVKVTRSCAILITNHNPKIELTTPQMVLYSGVCQIPPAPVIRPKDAKVSLFKKRPLSGYGSNGAFSYDVKLIVPDPGNAEAAKLFFMWSVPSGAKTTYHAIGSKNTKITILGDFHEMYHGSDDWFRRQDANNSLKYEFKIGNVPVKVVASISNVGNAVWKIDIS